VFFLTPCSEDTTRVKRRKATLQVRDTSHTTAKRLRYNWDSRFYHVREIRN